MLWLSLWELEPGNIDNFQLSPELTILQDLIKPENWDTRPRMDTLCTELESEEEEERDQYIEVLFVGNQLQLVLINLSPQETWDLKPKKESVELLED